ncbi:hypothetical protein TrVFT333_004641 [Trichoderma virens FT-333]|nr:hypothetical protein TrVFT333_004641 [Trichoderma virens FT-333]
MGQLGRALELTLRATTEDRNSVRQRTTSLDSDSMRLRLEVETASARADRGGWEGKNGKYVRKGGQTLCAATKDRAPRPKIATAQAKGLGSALDSTRLRLEVETALAKREDSELTQRAATEGHDGASQKERLGTDSTRRDQRSCAATKDRDGVETALAREQKEG